MAKTTELIMGCDHRGLELKDKLKEWISPDDGEGIRFDIAVMYDAGVHTDKRADYPKIVKHFSDHFDIYERGILVCGSGFGVAMAANRFPKTRAVVCRTVKEVITAREHNDMNVLCLGADFTSFASAKKLVTAFFETKFLGGRYKTITKQLEGINAKI